MARENAISGSSEAEEVGAASSEICGVSPSAIAGVSSAIEDAFGHWAEAQPKS